METTTPYTIDDLLCWIDTVRGEFTKNRLVARLPYDRQFIAGMAQALPELSWCVASAHVERLYPQPRLAMVLQSPTIVPDSRREVGLVAFEGELLCPRGQPETLVKRLLQAAMVNTVAALGEHWDDDAYRLAGVKLKTIARRRPPKKAVGPASFGPALLNMPATDVMQMFQEYRARHLVAQALEHATPPSAHASIHRRI